MADFVRIRAADAPKGSKPDGARIRLIRDDGEGNCELYDEQVTYPERVHNPNAANFRFQDHIALNENEQRWLRDALTEMLGEPVDTAGLLDEIAKLRTALAEACDTGMRWAALLSRDHNDAQDRTRLAEIRKLVIP